MNLGKLVIAITGTTKGLRKAATETNKILKGIGKSATSLPAILGGAGAAGVAVSLAGVADSYADIGSQLEFLAGNTQDAARNEAALYEISKKTGVSMEDNAATFTKFAQASELTGLTSEQNLKVLETLNVLMQKTGTSGQQAGSAMVQLGQALTSGQLAGDEFKSLAENAPGLLKAMGDAMGIARADMKQLGSEGKLTSERLGAAFLKIAESGQAVAEDLPAKFSKGWNMIRTAIEGVWDRLNTQLQLSERFEAAMQRLTWYVEDNADAFIYWFDEGLGKIIDNKDQIIANFTAIGGVILKISGWIAQAITGWQDFIDRVVSGHQLWQAQQDLARQQQFVQDSLTPDEQERYNQIGNELDASRGNTVINNFNQNVSRSDVENITNSQSLQGARY